ncbi:hypothetical protein SUGI_0531970 [Cryptomeria japonica]|uniref:chaperone protein dnaJ 20, chloroplastic n=1 Tax=Cryptomeria japonica TaxID=3369 RepID=UPI002408C704|nr:chaperone protein dnaJ 20, chloroplastic [Cryptomeria japonica]GLJ27132.1 hypothetical protein SUGI_0531970 [Cryptomeria japonica]
MELNASVGGCHGVHLMAKAATAGISRVTIGARSKQSALKTATAIRSIHCHYATNFSSSSSLYDVLCISPSVSVRDIKSAYRRMALKYHPDVCPAAEKEECSRLFLQVQEAHETLSDPLLRQDYDWRLQNGMEINQRGERIETCDYVWEGQIMELIKRRSGYNSSSWGSRMRRRNEHAAACS